jgi:Tropinone reductase 1
MNERWTLNGKTALVTGGTRGIGKAIVKEFAELGAEVIFTARNRGDIDNEIKLITNNDQKITGIKSDVTDKDERNELFKMINDKWGKLDILVNNAGTNIRKKTMDITESEYNTLIDIDMNSVWEMCRLYYELLKRSGNGSIINITSVAGITTVGTGSHYAMAKAAVTHLTKYLAVEWAEERIRVNAVAPWYIKTPLTESVLLDMEKYRHILERTPMKKIGKPEDVAAAAAFLAMPCADYITGECIAVDGGFLKKGF